MKRDDACESSDQVKHADVSCSKMRESQQGVQGVATVVLIRLEASLGVSRWWSCKACLEQASEARHWSTEH